MSDPKWPTLGETNETCPRCGERLTGAMITSRWSPTRFTVACPCSPARWIEMEIPPAYVPPTRD
jgi:hypothetical protein